MKFNVGELAEQRMCAVHIKEFEIAGDTELFFLIKRELMNPEQVTALRILLRNC